MIACGVDACELTQRRLHRDACGVLAHVARLDAPSPQLRRLVPAKVSVAECKKYIVRRDLMVIGDRWGGAPAGRFYAPSSR